MRAFCIPAVGGATQDMAFRYLGSSRMKSHPEITAFTVVINIATLWPLQTANEEQV